MFITVYAEESLFKIKSSTDKLPPEIYELDNKLYELGQNRPYEIVFVLANDLGVGDDYGYTHEFKIVGVTKLKNGIRISLSYTSDLYTEKIGEKNADGLTPQHFLDENIGKFMADNIESGKFYYWKGEVGWQQLSDVPSKNLLRGSAQQIFFHKLINPFVPQKQPLNISEGYGQENGVKTGVSVGVQRKYQVGSLTIHPQAEVGVSKSTVRNSDYKYASASLESTYIIKGEYRVNVVAEYEKKKHTTGIQNTKSLNASFEGKHWVVGAGVYANSGELDNHTRYNRPNANGKIDPIYMIYGSYRFGRGKSNGGPIVRPKEMIAP